MKLLADHQEEYALRHNPIWADLEEVLKEHGVSNYSIFLDADTDILFAYAEIDSEGLWQTIADTEVCQRWWKFMSNLMETNDDSSPVSVALEEVFHLD